MVTGDDDPDISAVVWPAFPWNPRNLKDPIVGRDYAIEELEEGWRNVVGQWRSRIHLLVAEKGMGKARLASIFVNRTLLVTPETWVIRCKCPRYGSTYRLWDVILRTAFGISKSADDISAGEGLLEAVERYLPEEALEVTSLIAYLTHWEVPGRAEAHLQADHDALVSRATGALARLFAAMSLERPMLVIVDNADRASESLVVAGALETSLKHRPFMLLLLGSMNFVNILPGWDRFPATQLGALLPEDSRAMLRLFLAGLGEPPIAFEDQVVEKAGGSPQAIKAIVRYIRETGFIAPQKGGFKLKKEALAELDLPDDLESLLLARIGKLAPRDKEVLALAGVVGNAFWLGALVAIERREDNEVFEPGTLRQDERPERIRKVLQTLIKRRFIETRPSNIPGEESFAFLSDLHAEVATNLVPAVKRQQIHGIVEQWLLLNVSTDSDPYLEDLAHHAEHSGQVGRAARYLLRAAKVARLRLSPVDERRNLLSARALVTPEDAQTYYSVHFELGGAMQRVGDLALALESYQASLQIAWRMRNRTLGARSLTRIGEVESERGAYESSYAHFHRALQLHEAIGDTLGIGEVCNQLGRMYWLRGAFDNALRAYDRAEQIFEAQRHDEGVASTVHAVAAIYAERGDLSIAEERYQRALSLRRNTQDLNAIASTLNDLGCIWMMQGRTEASLPLWKEGVELAMACGERSTEATLRDSYGEGLLTLGRLDEAQEQLEQAVRLAETVGATRVHAYAALHLSHVCLAAKNWSCAGEALDTVQAVRLDLPRLNALTLKTQADLAFGRLELPKPGEKTKKPPKKSTKEKKKGSATAAAKPKKLTKAQIKSAMGEIEDLYRRAIDALEESGYDGDAAQAREDLARAFDQVSMKAKAKKERKAAEGLRELHVS